MKKFVCCLVLALVVYPVFSQADTLRNWILDWKLGVEAHDKRMFDYVEKESLLQMQPEFFGTYHFGFDVKRKFYHNDKVSSFVGIGIAYENATFLRPFDHSCFEEDSFRILRNLDRYKNVKSPISISALYQLNNNWIVSGVLVSNVLLYRNIDHSTNDSESFPYSERTMELYDFNFRLGMYYRTGKCLVGINYRLANLQRVDKIIFNEIVKDPRTDQNWEWINPLRCELSIGYMW